MILFLFFWELVFGVVKFFLVNFCINFVLSVNVLFWIFLEYRNFVWGFVDINFLVDLDFFRLRLLLFDSDIMFVLLFWGLFVLIFNIFVWLLIFIFVVIVLLMEFLLFFRFFIFVVFFFYAIDFVEFKFWVFCYRLIVS